MHQYLLKYSVMFTNLLYSNVINSFYRRFCRGVCFGNSNYAGDVLETPVILDTYLENRFGVTNPCRHLLTFVYNDTLNNWNNFTLVRAQA